MRRVVSLFLPNWPAERWLRAHNEGPSAPEAPLILALKEGNRRIVHAACKQARALGVWDGMAVSQAQAMLPGLRVETADPEAECGRYATLLGRYPLDLCCLGIGENGHLAFNDPPVAAFTDRRDVKEVELEAACRLQQVNEGHFPGLDDVPTHAITVTIPALLRAGRVLAIVPEGRKAQPVTAALTGPITTACPASALRTISHATVYLEPASARLLPD